MTRLETARRAAGLTQEALGDLAGVSQGYVALLERGYIPRRRGAKLDAIADALDLNGEQVFPLSIPDDRMPAELAQASA